MAGVVDFSEFFTDTNQQELENAERIHRPCCGIPDPPVLTDIPDLDTLWGGDGRNSLLDLQPSQWLPPSQSSSTQKRQQPCQAQVNTVSERGDCDDIYLGSQYPVVQKIGSSQVPKSNPEMLWHFQSSQRIHSQTPQSQVADTRQMVQDLRSQGNKKRAFVYPKKADQTFTAPKKTYFKDVPNGAVANRGHSQMGDRVFVQPVDRIGPQSGEKTLKFHPPRNRNFMQMRTSENDRQENLFEESGNGAIHEEDQEIRDNSGIKFKAPVRKLRDSLHTPSFVAVPLEQYRQGVRLKPVTEIPENFRKIFNFPHFNIVQSKVFDDVMYTDKSLVLCSPTGSGKTAVFEMAIVRLMSGPDSKFSWNFKIVYMAPIKALCSERFNDWKEKFEPYGFKVMELTGDTDTEEFYEIQNVNIVLTTPEKWDSMTRKWRDNKSVMQAICLFLIDEIHILNDPNRGSVVEAVVSRMKTIQATRQRTGLSADFPMFRFVAISATITNIEDLAEWLGHGKNPAVHYKFDDSARPVRLRKVVLGYYFAEHKQSEFQFDISLSYKLAGVINTYSDDKPTLIFCATRKSSMQGAEILAKDVKSSYVRNAQHRLALQTHSFHIKDAKLRDLLVQGLGYHHAGMDVHDRKVIEEIFGNGELPVLVATSTLAMGVNLPAHLVIIKSTMYYNMGSHQEYPDTQVLQMIGRAGRPQFDTSATAVIMTKNSTKMKYENLLNGTQLIESSLHKNLVEHLNAEIVLNTITDISVAVEWLKYTFLYIRVMKNPAHYGMPKGLTKQSIEKRLQDMCIKGLNQLHHLSLIQMNEENMDVKPTESGRLMARYCISYKTAELFLAFKGDESISDMLSIISKCEEFGDVKLRNNEKKTLNTLNKDKNRITIRYPMTGKIKTADMKVNCLIQATLGSLLIQDFALQQDVGRIFRAGIRVTRCLVELLFQRNNFRCLLSALLLCKCFKAKLWEDSKYVSKQLDGIGPTLSTALVNAGLTSFEKLEEANPREIELIVNRHPPFGNHVKGNVAKLPKYELVIEQVMRYSVSTAEIVITIQITNRESLREKGTAGHTCTLLVGDADNRVVFKQRIMDALLLRDSSWSKKLEVRLADKGAELFVHYISQDWVGLDIECTYTPNYLGRKRITSSSKSNKQLIQTKLPMAPQTQGPSLQPCQHSCHNKMACGHECCKHGVSTKRRNSTAQPTPKPASTKPVTNHVEEMKNRALCLPPTPNVAKRARLQDNVDCDKVDLTSFTYTPNSRNQFRNTSLPNMQSQHSAISDSHLDTLEETIPLSRYDRQKIHTFPTRPQSNPVETKIKNDWPELDMYTKYRQLCQTEEDYNEEEQDSLPDLETTFKELANPGPDQHASQNQQMPSNIENDFAHETDYGYTYICSEDQATFPSDWQDRLSGQWQKTNNRANEIYTANEISQNGKSYYLTQEMHTDEDDKFRYKPYNELRLPSKNQLISSIKSMPATTDIQFDDRYQSDYDIADYSDESFEADFNWKPVNATDSVNPQSKKRLSVSSKDALAAYSQNKSTEYEQNFSDVMQDTNIADLKDKADFDKCRQSEYYPPKTEGNRNSPAEVGSNEISNVKGISRNWNDKATMNAFSEEFNEAENIDPDLHDDMYSENLDKHKSKWTDYFSSQSSTASDNLYWKYPATNGENEVVLQTCSSVNAQGSQQQTGKDCDMIKDRRMYNTSSTYNVGQAHKYGQVLAWVSNPDNHQSGREGHQSGDAEKKCLENSDSFLSSSKARSPDKADIFAGIFDGIL